MYKIQPVIVICLIIYSLISNAQDFTEVSDAGLIGVVNGSVDWGDYDNDGYIDIIITGIDSEGANTKIFKNNGNNTFTEQTDMSLMDIESGSVSWEITIMMGI